MTNRIFFVTKQTVGNKTLHNVYEETESSSKSVFESERLIDAEHMLALLVLLDFERNRTTTEEDRLAQDLFNRYESFVVELGEFLEKNGCKETIDLTSIPDGRAFGVYSRVKMEKFTLFTSPRPLYELRKEDLSVKAHFHAADESSANSFLALATIVNKVTEKRQDLQTLIGNRESADHMSVILGMVNRLRKKEGARNQKNAMELIGEVSPSAINSHHIKQEEEETTPIAPAAASSHVVEVYNLDGKENVPEPNEDLSQESPHLPESDKAPTSTTSNVKNEVSDDYTPSSEQLDGTEAPESRQDNNVGNERKIEEMIPSTNTVASESALAASNVPEEQQVEDSKEKVKRAFPTEALWPEADQEDQTAAVDASEEPSQPPPEAPSLTTLNRARLSEYMVGTKCGAEYRFGGRPIPKEDMTFYRSTNSGRTDYATPAMVSIILPYFYSRIEKFDYHCKAPTLKFVTSNDEEMQTLANLTGSNIQEIEGLLKKCLNRYSVFRVNNCGDEVRAEMHRYLSADVFNRIIGNCRVLRRRTNATSGYQRPSLPDEEAQPESSTASSDRKLRPSKRKSYQVWKDDDDEPSSPPQKRRPVYVADYSSQKMQAVLSYFYSMVESDESMMNPRAFINMEQLSGDFVEVRLKTGQSAEEVKELLENCSLRLRGMVKDGRRNGVVIEEMKSYLQPSTFKRLMLKYHETNLRKFAKIGAKGDLAFSCLRPILQSFYSKLADSSVSDTNMEQLVQETKLTPLEIERLLESLGARLESYLESGQGADVENEMRQFGFSVNETKRRSSGSLFEK